MTQPFLAGAKAAVERDYKNVLDHRVLLERVCGVNQDGTQVDRNLNPPLLFWVRSSEGSLFDTKDGWMDPMYSVEPCSAGDPQLAGLEELWCYGTSYRVDQPWEQPEPGDVTGVLVCNPNCKPRVTLKETNVA